MNLLNIFLLYAEVAKEALYRCIEVDHQNSQVKFTYKYFDLQSEKIDIESGT